MLDKLPAWLRHALIALGGSLLTVAVPVLAQHQEDVRDFIVRTCHLPIVAAPILGTLLTMAVLALTNLTRQYGKGATTPPTVPVIDPTAGPDVPTGGGMAG